MDATSHDHMIASPAMVSARAIERKSATKICFCHEYNRVKYLLGFELFNKPINGIINLLEQCRERIFDVRMCVPTSKLDEEKIALCFPLIASCDDASYLVQLLFQDSVCAVCVKACATEALKYFAQGFTRGDGICHGFGVAITIYITMLLTGNVGDGTFPHVISAEADGALCPVKDVSVRAFTLRPRSCPMHRKRGSLHASSGYIICHQPTHTPRCSCHACKLRSLCHGLCMGMRKLRFAHALQHGPRRWLS
mmetsp:Transcript_114021/g.219435  ORF Transcript_114021/g.219435 Transcript_114021/m.219435 type:complete len:252 (+) Transcript_114021:205-960(+)